MAEESAEELAAKSDVTGKLYYIPNIIAAINPEMYSTNAKDVRKALKNGFWQGAKIAKPLEGEDIDEHKIIYDSSTETLEPIYFWFLDAGPNLAGKPEKLVDTFASSPGSGHFSEMGAKATQMQDQASKILGNVNTVIKSVINILYDLKEFKIRLEQYSAAESKNKDEREAAMLSLKQLWMDNVDVKRGRGSINMLAQDLNFVTIRDAFMIVNDESLKSVDGKDLDLNDRVKRILKPRIQEFLKWKEASGSEIKKRYEIQKTYLKSQINSLKLYTRWAKPYLKSASLLEQKDLSRNPAVVTAFNTVVLELTLLHKRDFDAQNAVFNKDLPQDFRNLKLKRQYASYVLVNLMFRGIPQRVGQHYTFGGRAEVTFRPYSLNDDEYTMLKQKLDEAEFNEAMKLVQGVTDESLAVLQKDIDDYMKEESKEKKEKADDTNPFAALFGLAKKKEKKDEKEKIEEVKADNYIERLIRAVTFKSAKENNFKIYDVYKKQHQMPSHPDWYYTFNAETPNPKWTKWVGL